jgi:hypothetical protein
VTGKITHIPLFRVCISYHINFIICIAALFLFIISISTGFCEEKIFYDDTTGQPAPEPVYIIPDQSYSPLKFGVAITPDYSIQPMDSAFFHSDMNQLDDGQLQTQRARASTVVKIALDEFHFFSGLNNLVKDLEKTMHCYTRKFMLTGELNLDQKNAHSLDYIEKVNLVAHIYDDKPKKKMSHYHYSKRILSQFEINKMSWNIGLNFKRPGISLKIEIGEALTLHSSVGADSQIGAMIKLSI